MGTISDRTAPKRVPSVYPPPATDGCIIHYDMQDSGRLMIDRSGYGHHGLVDAPILVPGPWGHRMEFDGVDDGIVVPTNSVLQPNDLTMFVTVEFRELKDTVVYVPVANSSILVGQIWTLCAYPHEAGLHRLNWVVYVTDMWGSWVFSILGPVLKVGIVYRIGCVFRTVRPAIPEEDDGEHYTAVWVNGELAVEESNVGAPIAWMDVPLSVGRYDVGFGELDGWVYDFRLFNRALSTEELRDDARANLWR